MKKIFAAVLLALSLVFLVPGSAARADVNCVDKILDPIIGLPITVCVDVPLVPTLPIGGQQPVPVPPVVQPPVTVPPVVQPPGTTTPSVPAQTGTAPAPVLPGASVPSSPVPTPQAPVPTPTETAGPSGPLEPPHTPESDLESDIEEALVFPAVIFVLFLTILFGGYRLYEFLATRRRNKLLAESEENV